MAEKHGKKSNLVLVLLAAMFLVCLCLASCSQKTGANLSADQRLADFHYLYDVFKDNHPYVTLEGNDWLSKKDEFERLVNGSKDNEGFVAAISQILFHLNNPSTRLVDPVSYEGMGALPKAMEPWTQAAAKTDEKTVAAWHGAAEQSIEHPKGHTLPFRAYYNAGQYLVYWMNSSFKSASGMDLGCTITTVNGKDVHEFVSELAGKLPLKRDPYRDLLFMNEFVLPADAASYKIGLRDGDGNAAETDAAFGKIGDKTYAPVPPTNLERLAEVNIYTITLGGGKVAYLHLKDMPCYSDAGAERATLLALYKRSKDLPAFIIDLRNCGGGDDSFWMYNIVQPLLKEPVTAFSGTVTKNGEYLQPFLKASEEFHESLANRKAGESDQMSLVRAERTPTPQELAALQGTLAGTGFNDPSLSLITINPSGEAPYGGKIFVLTGPNTLSAGDNFAAFCKSSGWATVVGEHTGGDGGGPLAVVTLPNSKIMISFPSAMGLNPDLTTREQTHTVPHVLCEQEADVVIEYAKARAKREIFTGPVPDYDSVLRQCLDIALSGITDD